MQLHEDSLMMKPRSLRAAEREFFRNFFAAVSARGQSNIDRRDPQMPLRFLAAVRRYGQWLERERTAHPERDLDVEERLLVLLGPDPLSGTMLALERALVEFQFSDLSVSDSSCESLRLLLPKHAARDMLDKLAGEERALFAELAETFSDEQHELRHGCS